MGHLQGQAMVGDGSTVDVARSNALPFLLRGQFDDLARERHQQWRAGQYPIRVFLLGDRHETHFEKESKGGMQTSKRYFDVGHHKPVNAADLAKKLSREKWE